MKTKHALFLAASLLSLTFHASASTVLFSTLGPGDTFLPSVGVQIGGGYLGHGGEEVAAQFVPAADAVLTQIRAAVFNTSASRGDRDLVVEVSKGDLPGTPIDTFLITMAADGGGVYTFNSTREPALVAGEQYWITLSSLDLVDNLFGWNINDIGSYSIRAARSPGQSLWEEFYNASPAFEVSGRLDMATPARPGDSGSPIKIPAPTTPEPSSCWMFGTGSFLILVGAAGKRRRAGGGQMAGGAKFNPLTEPAIHATAGLVNPGERLPLG